MPNPSVDKSNTVPTRVRRLAYKDKKKAVKLNEPIPNSFTIMRRSIRQVWLNKRLFFGVMLVYIFLYLLLVRGFATNFQLPDTKQLIEDAGVEADKITLGISLLGAMFGTVGSTSSQQASVFQLFLFVFISLVLIWVLRQTYSLKSSATIKQALTSSMGPLVQYILVWLVICIQLVPALAGISIYTIVVDSGIAVGNIENAFWLILMISTFVWSGFMLSSSLFATYIVTLPGATPLVSLRKAKKLVKFRRFAIIRKAIFMPLLMTVASMLVFFPLVIYLPVLAEILFMFYIIFLIFFGHAYFYNLYKALI